MISNFEARNNEIKNLSNFLKNKTSDEELVKLYLETQNDVYFNAMYSRFSTKIYSKCLFLLKDQERAADATQDVFMKIILNLGKFSGKSKFGTWVYSITYNYCIDLIRKNKKQRNLFDSELDSISEPIQDISDKELLEIKVSRLKVILEKIPEGDKIVLLMKYQSDMSIKEIAESLNKSESAIKMKLKRAKHKAYLKHQELFEN